MKKVFAIIAMMGVFTFGTTQAVLAQDEVSDETSMEQVDSAAVDSLAADTLAEEIVEETAAPAPEVQEGGMYKTIKTKFIEGDAGFMALVAIALVLGLAFCIERIIYLALADVNVKKMIVGVENALISKSDVEAAKSVCRETRGPIASIYYQGLMRINEGVDSVEKSVVAYGAVQASNLEKGCSWITLFIGMAPSLGFLGTVIGMVQAFDDIQAAGDISPTVVAGGMKVALLTTIFGIVVALILQVFYNYILAKIESLTAQMEDSTITLLDIVTKYNLKK
ncbi:MAG: MotA/TolQ/ExbB proton channel family protein [Bacteroides sp.]|nr:MotA/TolQ/ExbB proton channel family protein [Roseburia sp.]MCM1345746.1 MotA/TolQ/ExbB proton channel family protein [Bacteroides sp.]MCM1420159.1 MotA/TolQ/ExbB proton channel family protein [Bacteroides sp.]